MLPVKSAVCVGEISPVVKDSVHLQLTHQFLVIFICFNFFVGFFFFSSLKKEEINTTCAYTVCFNLKVFEWSFCCCSCVFTCYNCLIATDSDYFDDS